MIKHLSIPIKQYLKFGTDWARDRLNVIVPGMGVCQHLLILSDQVSRWQSQKQKYLKHTLKPFKHFCKISNRRRISKKGAPTDPSLEVFQNSCTKSLMSVIIASFTTSGEWLKLFGRKRIKSCQVAACRTRVIEDILSQVWIINRLKMIRITYLHDRIDCKMSVKLRIVTWFSYSCRLTWNGPERLESKK